MARKSTPKGFAEPKTPYGVPRSGGKAAAEIAQGKRKLPKPETLPDGTVRYFLVLGPKGRVLLPADLRAAMGLAEGDVITGWLKDGELRMPSAGRKPPRTTKKRGAGCATASANGDDRRTRRLGCARCLFR